jgi:Rieske Fe-S protein
MSSVHHEAEFAEVDTPRTDGHVELGEGVSRRSLLGLLAAAALGLPWIGGSLLALANYANVPTRSFTGAVIPESVPAGLLADIKEGEPKQIMFGEDVVFVIKKGSTAVAFSGVCPHAGCLVEWFPADKVFKCPCHGGHFELDGKCVAGPPPRGLFEHSVKISMGRVIVGRKKDA